MRILMPILLLAALALAGCSDDEPSSGSTSTGTGTESSTQTGMGGGMPMDPETHMSTMRSNRFEPADLTVRVGDTVHWMTEDPQAHNVVSTTPGSEFRSADISTVPVAYEQEFSYTFTQEGVVDYLCEYHSGMVGTVTVTAAN